MKLAVARDVAHREVMAAAAMTSARSPDEACVEVDIAIVDAVGNLAAFLLMPEV